MIPMEMTWDGEGHSLKLIEEPREEQRNAWDEMASLVNGVKKVYQLNLRIHEVTLEFGMQLNRFLAMIVKEEVSINPYGKGQIVDIMLSSSNEDMLIETGSKIQSFSKVKGYKVIVK